MLSKVDVVCVYGFPQGDEKTDRDGDGNFCIPTDGYGDGNGHGKSVARTGMGV